MDQFAKAGIKLHIERLVDRATFLDTTLKGTALFRSFSVGAAAEPKDQFLLRYHSTAVRNCQRYRNPDIDQMIDNLDRLLESEAHKKLTLDIQRKIMDDVALVHLFWATE